VTDWGHQLRCDERLSMCVVSRCVGCVHDAVVSTRLLRRLSKRSHQLRQLHRDTCWTGNDVNSAARRRMRAARRRQWSASVVSMQGWRKLVLCYRQVPVSFWVPACWWRRHCMHRYTGRYHKSLFCTGSAYVFNPTVTVSKWAYMKSIRYTAWTRDVRILSKIILFSLFMAR